MSNTATCLRRVISLSLSLFLSSHACEPWHLGSLELHRGRRRGKVRTARSVAHPRYHLTNSRSRVVLADSKNQLCRERCLVAVDFSRCYVALVCSARRCCLRCPMGTHATHDPLGCRGHHLIVTEKSSVPCVRISVKPIKTQSFLSPIDFAHLKSTSVRTA